MWKAIGANKNSEPSGVWRISKWGNYSRSVRFNQNLTGKRETKFTETYSRSWKSNRWWERNIVEEKHTGWSDDWIYGIWKVDTGSASKICKSHLYAWWWKDRDVLERIEIIDFVVFIQHPLYESL